jgi:hypothetical protein
LLPKYHRKSDIQCNYKGDERGDGGQRDYEKCRTEDVNYPLPKRTGSARTIHTVYIDYAPYPSNGSLPRDSVALLVYKDRWSGGDTFKAFKFFKAKTFRKELNNDI